jgi:diguanylate cyclase (GGDEF)-like protein
MANKITEFLFKDVTNANESNRVSFIVRINSLMMCVYFLIWITVFGITERYINAGICFGLMCVYAVSVYLTYRDKNSAALLIYCAITTVWMFRFVVQWGWECGIQHFVFVLLVLVFVASYKSFREKMLSSLIVFSIRMFLYTWHITYPPVEELSRPISVTFQIINIVSIFFSLIVILSIFTRDKLATEAKLARYNSQLKAVAEHDHLTGLLNRRSGTAETVDKIMNGSFNYGMSIAMADIDHFKKINDTYGHDAGDEVLKKLAGCFKEFMKHYGIAVRWGGEEFLFVFDDMNLDDAFVALDGLRLKIANLEIPWKGQRIPVTMTFGVTDINVMKSASDTDLDIENRIMDAITDADKKLYMGKESGRNKVVI